NHLFLPVRRGQGHHRRALQWPPVLSPAAQRSCLMNPIRNSVPAPQVVRCAIYTRKSTEEGLDQEFNSLAAQREAAEAYLASQQHAGWTLLPERYDDGGYTGGTIERPALAQVLRDIAAGPVDCVLVYKVDPLTHALGDFG